MPIAPTCPYDGISSYGPWPTGGEIDIAEFGVKGSSESDIVHALHFGGTGSTGGHAYNSKKYTLPSSASSTFTEDFHVFSLEWAPDKITWFVDGIESFSMSSSQWWTAYSDELEAPFDSRFYLILNLAVGGNFPDPVSDMTPWPMEYVIDYVRVYEDANMPTIATQAPTPTPSGTRVNFNVEMWGTEGMDFLASMSDNDYNNMHVLIDAVATDDYSYSYTYGENGGTKLMDYDGDKVFSGSAYLEDGEYKFKFFPNGDVDAPDVGADCNGDGFVITVNGESELDVNVCWGECGESCLVSSGEGNFTPTEPGVTIYADLSSLDKGSFVDSNGNIFGGAYVASTFNSWSPLNHKMVDTDKDGIFQVTLGSDILSPGDSHQFIFTINGWNEKAGAVPWSTCDFLNHDEWPNWGFTVPSDFDFESDKMVLGPFCWNSQDGSCKSCSEEGVSTYVDSWAASSEKAKLKIEVDLRNAIPDLTLDECPASLWMTGSFESWSGWGLEVKDEDGDGIFSVEYEGEEGESVEFIFLPRGNGWDDALRPPGHSSCDFKPDDLFYNFGTVMTTKEMFICPGYCDCSETVEADAGHGPCGGEGGEAEEENQIIRGGGSKATIGALWGVIGLANIAWSWRWAVW
jgi:hypothetical protein